MESGQASGVAPAAKAGAKRTLWVIVAIIVAIAVIASAMVFVVLPSLQPSVAKFNLVALDFGYDQTQNPDLHPLHHVKVNQPVWIVFSNDGTNVHEFLLFKDKDAALVAAKADLAIAISHHPNYQTNDTEKNATLDEYNTLHDADSALVRYNNIDRNVDPGNTTDLLFVIHEAGTYFFACHQVDTTTSTWIIHQEHGMWGTLIVDP